MSEVIRTETAVFLLSVAHGILLTLFYDLLRILRRVFTHSLLAISVEDFLFWLAAGFLTFCLAFLKTDGVIRGYVAAGIVLGAVLYHMTVSEWIVKGLSWLLGFGRRCVSRLIRTLWRLLGMPGRWVLARLKPVFGKISGHMGKKVGKSCINFKKRIEISHKKGYNVTKECSTAEEIKWKRGKDHGRKKKKAAKQE